MLILLNLLFLQKSIICNSYIVTILLLLHPNINSKMTLRTVTNSSSSYALLAFIAKYGVPTNQWTWLCQALLEVSTNTITLWIHVCVDDWAYKSAIKGSNDFNFIWIRLGGAVITHSPLTAMAWVWLWLRATCGCLLPFTANAWQFSLWGFLPPSEGLKIVPFGTVS